MLKNPLSNILIIFFVWYYFILVLPKVNGLDLPKVNHILKFDNHAAECHSSLFNFTYLIQTFKSAQSKTKNINVNLEIYNIFLQIFDLCGYDNSIAELSLVFNATRERVIKIINCFGQKIPVVVVNEMPSLSLVAHVLFIMALGLFLLISVLGNSSLLFYLMGMKRLSKINCNCFKVNPKPIVKKPSSNCTNTHAALTMSETYKVTDLFFINCAIFDLCFSLFIVPIQIADALNNGIWKFSDISCKCYAYLNYVMLSINMITLMSVAIDRYSLIVINCVTRKENKGLLKKILNKLTCSKTLRSMNEIHLVKLKTYLWIFFFILISFIISFPFYIFSEKTSVVKGGNCLWITDDYMCINSWQNIELYGNAYKISFFFIVYIVPIAILVYCYSSISFKLSQKSITRPNAVNLSKKRLIKILIFDSVFYLICWLPFLIFMLYLCINDILQNNIEFDTQWYAFNILYLGPIGNVAFKWIFRALCSLNRFKKTIFKNMNDISLRSIAIVTPIAGLYSSPDKSR